MKTPRNLRPSSLDRARRLVAGALVFSAATAFAQTGDAGSASGGAESQADRDVDAARRASGTGASGTGASGTGAAGTGTGNDAAGGMERARERHMPGARPGDAPAQRSTGAVGEESSSSSDATPTEPSPGGAPGSRPGAGLGGMPSDGTAGETGVPGAAGGAEEARRDPRTTARMIGETSFAYRDRAMTMVERELGSGNALSSSILRGSAALSGSARTRVDDSVARAHAARTELSKAISRARSANEDRWESSRSEVADRYEDYVKALEEAREAATEGGVQLRDDAGASATMPAPR